MSSYNNEQINPNPYNKRFYHVFKHGELELLIEEASKTIVGSKIVKSYYDHGNWCAIVQKDIWHLFTVISFFFVVVVVFLGKNKFLHNQIM